MRRIEDRKPRKYLSQVQFIALGFLIMIMLGTVLLMTPAASRTGEATPFLSALFTATSASCVTGLVVADTSTHWSLFGQLVIITLIQIGGLGFITVGVFFSIILRRKIGLRERGLIMESTNSLKIGGVVKLTKLILSGTLIVEAVGAAILSIRFVPEFGFWKGIWFGVFHSVSAFCNAGFDLMGSKYGKYSSLVAYYRDPIVNIVIMALIVVGGLGFVVWADVLDHKWEIRKYRLHTKIVLMLTAILIFGGGILFYMTEYDGVMQGMDLQGRVLASLFSSVTARTAGFNTVDTAGLSDAGKILTMVLMYVGGNPGSTAGGVKTTTVLVLLANMHSGIRRSYGINIFNRRLEEDVVHTAATIAVINLGLVVAAAFVVTAIQKFSMADVFFEAFSAMGTVGMTTGITRDLDKVSRFVMIVLMYLGRVGSLSFALAFMQSSTKARIQQPKESISIG